MLPAVLLHDVGWKMFPEEKLAYAVGPNAKYPELQREHEIEGARIAREILALLWQIYSRRCPLQIHFRQCGHRCDGDRAISAMMA